MSEIPMYPDEVNWREAYIESQAELYAATTENERLRAVALAAENVLKDAEAADNGREYTVNGQHGSLFTRLREALATVTGSAAGGSDGR